MFLTSALIPAAVLAAPFTETFDFSTVAQQNEWTVTTNNDANGPGVPQYGVPDSSSVRIAPIDAATKNTGDIRLYREIQAPAGTTFSNIVFSGLGQGYSSHVTWADILMSPDGNWGTTNTDPDVVLAHAASGYDEVALSADATGNPAYEGLTSVFLQIRIVDALAIGSPVTNSPYARALQFSADTTAVPEPASLGLLGGGVLALCTRRKRRSA
jgi:hypothetical protein